MAWIPNSLMAEARTIRQEYAAKREAYEQSPTPGTEAVFEEVQARRERAIRSLHRDGDMSIRHLAGMFGCTKEVIRTILSREEDQ